MRRFIALLVSCLIAAVPGAGGSLADVPPAYEVYSIGAILGDAEPFPKIASIVKGGPADKAGAHQGDGVIAIDGRYAKAGVPFYYFARGLGGRQGSEVELVLLRDGREVIVVKIRRTLKP
ncbi:MAG: PDZ domain-containing protein [Micropepsaceae bacterium]